MVRGAAAGNPSRASLELIDDVALRAVDGRGFVSIRRRPALIVEVTARARSRQAEELSRVGDICAQQGAAQTCSSRDESSERSCGPSAAISPRQRLKPHKISGGHRRSRPKIPKSSSD